MKNQTSIKIILVFLFGLCSGIMTQAQDYVDSFTDENDDFYHTFPTLSEVEPILIPELTFYTAEQNKNFPVSSSFPKAISAYHQALELAANARLKDYGKKMGEAAAIDPEFFMSYAHRAMVKVSFKQYEDAKVFIDKAAAFSSENLTEAEKIVHKLMVQWKKDAKSSPANVMTELVEAYPQHAEAYELAGSCAIWMDGDKEKALAYFEKAQQLRPTYGPGYNMLGYSYMNVDQMDEAKTAFEAYLQFSPNEANAYDSMGEYYMKINDYAQSAKYYDKATALGMKNAKERADKAKELMSK